MADSMNEKDYSKFKVADLKKELKTRGLSTAGNKNELIERLTLAVGDMLANDGIVDDTDDILDHDDDDDSTAEDIAGDEEEVLGQSIEEDEDLGPEEHNPPDVESAASEVATSQELSASGLRKIVLKRRPTTPPAESDPDQSVPESDAPAAPTASKTVKLSHLSSAERLELRAQKFGVPVTLETRKELRAVRFGGDSTQTSSTEVMKKRAERFGLSKDTNLSSDVLKKRAERFGITASDAADKNSSDILKRRAERFGISSTDATDKVELDEKIKKRQQRFGIVSMNKSNDERKKLRTERFKVK